MLIKVEDGLIEEENFLLTSPVEDFLGNAEYSRTPDKFILKQGKIERNCRHNEFVIEIQKEISELGESDRHAFFCRNKESTAGMEEISGQEAFPYWKIVCWGGWMQTYKSENRQEWNNAGGIPWTDTLYQGFEVEGDIPCTIQEYKVYKTPYIKIQNFPPGTKVQLLDDQDKFIKERVFDDLGTVRILLDFCMEGKLAFYDREENEIYTTGKLKLKYGDVYMETPYNIQMRYKGSAMEWRTTTLESTKDIVELVNLSEDNYSNLRVRVIKSAENSDTVIISLDDVTYFDEVNIESLLAHESRDIYIRIICDAEKNNYATKQFDLEVL